MLERSLKSVRLWVRAAGLALIALAGFSSSAVSAGHYNVGSKASCGECHEPEAKVWKGTKHYASFKKVHQHKKTKKILNAVATVTGDKRPMKRNKTCVLCHYTRIQKKAGGIATIKSGPSCESCHGAASEWVDIHNDYGGDDIKAEGETAAHKAKRLKDAVAHGFIMPRTMLFKIAQNCMNCHGLNHPDATGKVLSVMLDNEHPVAPNFEMVQYFSGSNRHRFYAPDTDVNKEMNEQEQATMFVVGQIAKLVSATNAVSKSNHPKYRAMQQQRVDDAKKVLRHVAVAEVKIFVAKPSINTGKKAVDALKGKDFSSVVGSLLPAKVNYK